MPSRMTAACAALALLTGSLTACGSDSATGTGTVSASDAQSIATTVATSVLTMTWPMPSQPGAPVAGVPDWFANLQGQGSIDETDPCVDGGIAKHGGTWSYTISDPVPGGDIGGTGAISIQGRTTHTDCKQGVWVMNGDPYISMASTITMTSWAISWPVSWSIGGSVKMSGKANVNCAVQMTFLINISTKSHLSGSACGRQVDMQF